MYDLTKKLMHYNLTRKSKDDMLKVRNLGLKSLEEVMRVIE